MFSIEDIKSWVLRKLRLGADPAELKRVLKEQNVSADIVDELVAEEKKTADKVASIVEELVWGKSRTV